METRDHLEIFQVFPTVIYSGKITEIEIAI